MAIHKSFAVEVRNKMIDRGYEYRKCKCELGWNVQFNHKGVPIPSGAFSAETLEEAIVLAALSTILEID